MKTICEGLRFPEGPVALADGSVLLVEIEAGALTRVFPDGRKVVVARPGGGPNGLAIGPDGAAYVCNNGGFEWHQAPEGGLMPGMQPANYSGGRIERIDLHTGEVRVLTPAPRTARCAVPTTSCSTPRAVSGSPTWASADPATWTSARSSTPRSTAARSAR